MFAASKWNAVALPGSACIKIFKATRNMAISPFKTLRSIVCQAKQQVFVAKIRKLDLFLLGKIEPRAFHLTFMSLNTPGPNKVLLFKRSNPL